MYRYRKNLQARGKENAEQPILDKYFIEKTPQMVMFFAACYKNHKIEMANIVKSTHVPNWDARA